MTASAAEEFLVAAHAQNCGSVVSGFDFYCILGAEVVYFLNSAIHILCKCCS